MDTTSQTLAQIYSTFGTQDFQNNWVAQDWTLKDKVGYAATNAFNFFANAAGAQDPNLAVVKKREQSNFQTPNQIGGDFFFVVQKIRCYVQNSAKIRQTSTTSSDAFYSARQLAFSRLMTAITSLGVLKWTVNQRVILTENQPFQTFGAGFGLGELTPPAVGTGAATAITSGANAYIANTPYDIDGGGMGDPFALSPIVVLAPSTTHQIDIIGPTGNFPSPASIYGSSANQTAQIWLCVYLDGQKVRPRS